MTLNIAHRGASGAAPENTFAAFDLAVATGADAIEIDLRMTSDGFLVALHDESLDRTGLARGYKGPVMPVSTLTLDQVKRHDVGTWFNETYPAMARAHHEGLTVPTLAEIFVRYGNSARLFLELKHPERDLRVVEEMAVLLRDFSLQDRAEIGAIQIASFHVPTLEALKKRAPYVSLVRLIPIEHLRTALDHLDSVRAFAVGVGFLAQAMDPMVIDRIRRAGLDAFGWTVNERPEMQRLIALGATGIITDHPESLRSLIMPSGPAPALPLP